MSEAIKTEIDIHFQSSPWLYIMELFDYQYDSEQNEGSIEINGYFYVCNRDEEQDEHAGLPRKKLISISSFRNKELVDYHLYHVSIYRRQIIKNTDVISTIEDGGGSEMNVCFFPTSRQRFFFKVLREIKSDNEYPDPADC